MPWDKQSRRIMRVENKSDELGDVVQQARDAIDTITKVAAQIGVAPLSDAPDGYRWKTPEEYVIEYRDAATTADRKQELIAIRLQLLPPESVALPQN